MKITNAINVVKYYYTKILMFGSMLFIACMLGGMIFILINQQKESIDYSPNFPVYREADTTETALVKNELIDTGKNLAKTQRSMEGNTIALILATLGILAGLFMNPLLLKVLQMIKEVKETNKSEHNTIYNELKIYKTETKTIANLNEILSHHLESAPTNISEFIAHEGRRLIYFAEVIMNSKFDYSIIASAKVKLDIAKREARHEIADMPAAFKKGFVKMQCVGVDRLYEELSEIVNDQTYNSKHNRFRMSCERFLNSHLTDILELNRKTNNT